MLDRESWQSLRWLHLREGKSQRWIAKNLGISRATVGKYVKRPDAPKYEMREPRRKPVADKWRPIVEKILEEDKTAPKKQRHTATRIYHRLKKEHGYTGSQRTITSLVAELRKRPAPSEVAIPLQFEPGKDAQVDFKEAWVDFPNGRRKVQVFEMRLNYSRKVFQMAFLSANREAFLEGHVRAFEYFGGVPENLTYDNLTLAVKNILRGKGRELDGAFEHLKGFYAFRSKFCQPGKKGAHEKGGVENSVGFTRRNWLVPVPKVADLEELNAYLLGQCQENDGRTVDGQSLAVGVMFEHERAVLLPLPARRFDPCTTKVVAVDDYATINWQTNRYSVPYRYCGRSVWLKAYFDRIEIADGEQVVAVHQRNYGRQAWVLNPWHYLDLLEMRPYAIPNARPLLQQEWPSDYWKVYNQLVAAHGEREGGKQFVQILRLHQQFGASVTEQSLKQAMGLATTVHSELVLSLIKQALDGGRRQQLDLAEHDALNAFAVVLPDLDRYQKLLTKEESHHEPSAA